MKLHKVLVFLCLATALGGCSRPQPAPQNGTKQFALGFPADDHGRAIELKTPAQRVVVIGPGATETIFALGAGMQLVGRDQISDYPAETENIPIIGDYNGPFIEKVIALKPDLMIVQGETYDRTRIENWQQKIGVPIAGLMPTSVANVEQGIRKIARWIGKDDKLSDILEDFPSHQKSPGYMHARRWSVFFEAQRSPLWTAGDDTLVGSQIAALGWQNVAADVKGYKQFSAEVLLKRDPEFYIVAQSNAKPEEVIRDLKKSTALRNLTAVRKGRVVVVDGDLLLRPGPRLPQGLKAMSAALSKIANRDMAEPGVLKK